MSLVTLRDAIKVTLASEISEFAKTYTHGGLFDEEELKRWSLQAPCCVVGPLGVAEMTDEGGQLVANMRWGAFVVAKDEPTARRDVVALRLLESVLAQLGPTQRWGSGEEEQAHAPDKVSARNLYGKRLDEMSLAMWLVQWEQGYDIKPFDTSALDDFLTYRAVEQLSDDQDVATAQDAVDFDPWEES